jgi:hypothetical protein
MRILPTLIFAKYQQPIDLTKQCPSKPAKKGFNYSLSFGEVVS